MGFMRRIKDGSVLDLIERFVKAKVTSELGTWTPEQGTPQGAVLSPRSENLTRDVCSYTCWREVRS
jgi:RNA-directed DNA polymerase